MRIVSLLPSATEILCGIGLADSLVGVSHECDFPESVRSLPRVTQTLVSSGGTGGEIDAEVRKHLEEGRGLFSLDRQLFLELRPDLVITQEICGVCAVAVSEVREAAQALGNDPTIVNLKPHSLADLFSEIAMVGEATNEKARADAYIDGLLRRVEAVKERIVGLSSKPRIVLLEWLDPLFSAGHWTPEIVEIAGGTELLGKAGERSKEIHSRELIEADPDRMVIACCGMRIEQARAEWERVKCERWWNDVRSVREGNVTILDGSAYFNRPGPRLVDSIEILADVLHSPDHRSLRPN